MMMMMIDNVVDIVATTGTVTVTVTAPAAM